MDIVKIIKDNLNKMTKSEYKVATYCLGNLNDFAFHTLDAVAEKIGVSTTSVIRFCRRLGFDGFKPLQEQVRLKFKSSPNLPDKFQRVAKGTTNELVTKVLNQNILCVEKTFAEIPYECLCDATHRISNAKRVFTFGMRESYAVSHYAYTRFLTVRDNVFMLNAGYNGEVETILSLDKEDVCIVFLFHRYTKQGLNVLKQLAKRNVQIILVTSLPCELDTENISVLLPCYVDTNLIKNSAIAPVCVMDYLCNAVSVSHGDASLEYMKQTEKLFDEFEILED